MRYLIRKTKEFDTEKEATDKEKELKDFDTISVNEKTVMTEKEIKSVDDITSDVEVDSVSVHICDHSSPSGGCKIVSLDEGKVEFEKIEKVEKEEIEKA